MNCQKEIAGQVIRQGGDWCLALKGNHRSLYEEAKQFCEYGVSNGFEVPVATHKEEDYSHGRCELREAWLLSVGDLGWLEGTGEWPGLKSIVWVRNTRRQKEQQSVESRCYVTSLVDCAQAARSIRGHWEVENCLHWVMDVDFGEDDCRARASSRSGELRPAAEDRAQPHQERVNQECQHPPQDTPSRMGQRLPGTNPRWSLMRKPWHDHFIIFLYLRRYAIIYRMGLAPMD